MLHRPDLEELLVDYATGGLSAAPSLFVAAHLSLNPQSRREVALLDGLGGALMEEAAPAVLQAPAPLPGEPAPTAPPAGSGAALEHLQRALAGEADRLAWKRIVPGVFDLKLDNIDDHFTTSLLRIRQGSRIAEHTHGGVEMTLVISGAFSDGMGAFTRGDVCIMDESGRHQPTARGEEDCICLVVTDGPLRFTGPLMRLLNPLLK